MHAVQTDVPERCQLEHKLFSTLGEVAFRRSSADGVPMMAVSLGRDEAFIPLGSLRRAFSIGPDSPDGRMLELIGSALNFVSSLQPGDKLPLEMRTGEASWQPGADHARVAVTKLQLRLVLWHAPRGRWAGVRDNAALLRMADDPVFQEHVLVVSHHAATFISADCANRVTDLLEDLGRELSYIEALREWLLTPVETIAHRCERLSRLTRTSAGLSDTIAQVVRLFAIADRQIRSRFEDVDGQSGEIISALRSVDSQRCFIRANRDWLYRNLRAWDPLLKQWAVAPNGIDYAMAAVLRQTYRFLAARYMPATEWPCQDPAKRRRKRSAAAQAF